MAMEDHVHLGERPSGHIHLLAADRDATTISAKIWKYRKQLDSVRAIRDFGDLINEVAFQLGDAEGGKVTITVEINAESDGFDDRTRRTVSENAAQLGFESHEFEE